MTPRALLRRLAGLKPKSSMRGRIEGVCCGVVWGWAVSRTSPERPATVELLLDGRPIGQATTTVLREDNATAAASGYQCGFVFDLRPHLADIQRGLVGVRDAATGLPFGGEEIAFDLAGSSGKLDRFSGIDVIGWATPHAPGQRDVEIEIRVDGKPVGKTRTDLPRPDLLGAGVVLARTGFRFAIPPAFHDGLAHDVTAHLAKTGAALQETPITFRAQIRAYVDRLEQQRVSGWIANLSAPTGSVRFDLWINGKRVLRDVQPALRRQDVEEALLEADAESCPIGFDLQWAGSGTWLLDGNSVELRTPGGDEALYGPVHAVEPDQVLAVVEAMAGKLLCDPSLQRQFAPELRAAGRELLSLAAGSLRARGAAPQLVRTPYAPDPAAPVDVIIPVYKGRDETIACLRSVLAAMNDGPAAEVIVIFDAGPDFALRLELREMTKAGAFTLIENDENLGFVATVNRGMRLHPERDVVLLNADTVVPRGWLQRLRNAALSAPEVATATPLSNRATIFSLPRTCVDNDMPLGLDVAALDALCAERNSQVRVDVPTAMGFCMYIRRAALVDVGLFDEQRWAMGYAEENDFSLRALARGWRHVAACDVFVEHHGAVSFGAEKPARVKENLDKLNAIYPDYPRRVERFIETDPIAPARGRVNMALLRRLAPSWVLYVSHGMGGGTDTAIHDLRRQHEAEGLRVLLLRSTPAGRMELLPLIPPHDRTLVTEFPRTMPISEMAALLDELQVALVHIHHTLGFDADIWQLPRLLGVPFEVTLHDYFAVCPRVTMIDASGRYCGDPDVAVCEGCVKSPALERQVRLQFDATGGSVAQWRSFHAARLREAARVVTPSEDAASRLGRRLPGVQVQCVPHVEEVAADPSAARERPGPLRNVAVVGAIGPHKGVDLLLEVATLAESMALPLRFVVFGYTSRDSDFAGLSNIEITGRYRQADLPRLLASSQCGTALFLSLWPETYSYTLSEAWRAGMLPVALEIGAPADRIREHGHGVLVPFPATARAVLEALSALERAAPSSAATAALAG